MMTHYSFNNSFLDNCQYFIFMFDFGCSNSLHVFFFLNIGSKTGRVTQAIERLNVLLKLKIY